MDAWRIDSFGGPEVLRYRRERVPAPSGAEILVRVAYCGVCRHDLLTRTGAFPGVTLPLTLGHQVSGTVVAAGPDAGLRVGDRVMSLIFMGCGHCAACRGGNQALCRTARAKFMGDDFDGGYAEYVRVPAHAFLRVPDELSLRAAAVINCTLGTAYHAAHTRGRVKAGDTVVVTGASGGIGLHALAVLRQAGARIIAVTSRPAQREMLREHGADEVIADPELAFSRPVKELTGGIGADLVLEVVGDPTLAQSLHAVRSGGRVVVIGNVDGRPSQVRIAHLVMKEISLLGTKSCSVSELTEVMRLVAAGDLELDISETLPLSEARRAHQLMEEGATNGRILLTVAGESGDGEEAGRGEAR
jgi:2-desacetyl-2-hydroxyethyl bacteriochlorophyllide A dehydrogenase